MAGERLREAGLRVWFDEWTIRPGDDIYLSVERGLEEARTLVQCLSAAALSSGWVKLERSTVIFRDPSNADRRFIPVLLEQCDLPRTLRRYRYVDFTGDDGAALRELVEACRLHLGTPDPVERPSATPAGPGYTQRREDEAKTGFMRAVGPLDHVSTPALARWESIARLRHTLAGHENTITRLDWAPDGIRLASGGQDGAVRIWNSETGTLLRTLTVAEPAEPARAEVYEHWATRIAWMPAWSPDGKTIACGYGDSQVRLWDPETGALRSELSGHSQKVNGVAWSADGTALASCSDDSEIRIWDLEQGDCVHTFEGHRLGVNTVAWDPGSRFLASASLDGTIGLWDMERYRLARTLKGHSDFVITVAWSPDGATLASSSADGTIRLWDAATGLQRYVIDGHAGPVSCIAFSAEGKLLASKGIRPDSTVGLWSTGDWRHLATLHEPSNGMWFAGIAFHREFLVLATLTNGNRSIRIWDLDPDRLYGLLRNPPRGPDTRWDFPGTDPV